MRKAWHWRNIPVRRERFDICVLHKCREELLCPCQLGNHGQLPHRGVKDFRWSAPSPLLLYRAGAHKGVHVLSSMRHYLFVEAVRQTIRAPADGRRASRAPIDLSEQATVLLVVEKLLVASAY